MPREPSLGTDCLIDVDKLVESRLIVQANSGAGKSWSIRRLAEQTYGKAQQIIIDHDGEYHTLREKFDYVLAGQKGDCPADIKSAALLARRLLELNVSAIVDIYELGTQRAEFVKRFLESLVNAPRDLWHSALVILDEAHFYCPETGSAVSSDAVKNLMALGRKRGFAGILATQRIAKLSKDAVAECMPPGSLVLTSVGPRPIETLVQGDLVLTHKGRYRPVTATMERPYEGDLIAVRTRGSNLETLVTPEHPFLVRECDRKSGVKVIDSLGAEDWRRAADLTDESYVVFPRMTEVVDQSEIYIDYAFTTTYRNGTKATIERPLRLPVNADLMQVIGYYLAEGSIARSGRGERVVFSFGKSYYEAGYAKRVQECLAKLDLHNSTYVKQGLAHVQCASTALARWMSEEFGDTAHTKRVPLWIKQLPAAKLRPLLEAYIDGDGYRPKNRVGQYEGRTVSADLATACREIMLKLNDDASIYYREPHPTSAFIEGRAVTARPYWVPRAGVKSGDRASLTSDDAALYLRVTDIRREHYIGKVYNISVEEDESYCTINHAVHNCNNKLIGRSALDVDMKRAAGELGFTTREDMLSLRTLKAGEFYAFGPAFTDEVKLVKIGAVQTTHLRAGQRAAPPTPPRDRVKKILAQLADLPHEAAEEVKSITELRVQVKQLKTELTKAKAAQPKTETKTETKIVEKPMITDGQLRRLEALLKKAEAAGGGFFALDKKFYTLLESFGTAVGNWHSAISALALAVQVARNPQPSKSNPIVLPVKQPAKVPKGTVFYDAPPTPKPPRATNGVHADDDVKIPKGEAAVLRAAIQFPDGLQKRQLTVLTGYKRSTRDAYILRLRDKGLLAEQGDKIFATEAGIAAMPDAEPLPTGEALREFWYHELPSGEKQVLELLVNAYPDTVQKPTIDEATGFKRSTRDAYLLRLGAKELVIEVGRAEVKASDTLFEVGA